MTGSGVLLVSQLCVMLLVAAHLNGQSGFERLHEKMLADAIAQVRAPGAENANALEHYVQVIEDARATEAAIDLESLAARVTQPDLKLKIEATLVRLGDNKPQYWQEVLAAATEAAISDMPFPYTESNQLDPYYKSKPWQSAATQEEMARASVYYPKAIMHLGETGDARGDPVLRLAARSPNILVVLAAASGLAELKDEAAVPLLLQVDDRLSPPMKGLLATTLIYFHGQPAENYVKRWMPKGQDPQTYLHMRPTPYSGVNLKSR